MPNIDKRSRMMAVWLNGKCQGIASDERFRAFIDKQVKETGGVEGFAAWDSDQGRIVEVDKNCKPIGAKTSTYTEKGVAAGFDRLAEEVETELRRRARLLLRSDSNLVEFVKAMGGCFFVDKDDEHHDADEFDPINELLLRWDDVFGLTGDPVRFTTDGPEVTEW
jgi:hypothetical protein